MEIVKKNLTSIIFGVIALLAVVGSFVPVGGMFTKLLADANTRKSKYDTLEGLLHSSHHLPMTDPMQTDPVELTQFPNDQMLDIAGQAAKRVASAAGDMLKAAQQINVHNPLVPDLFPAPATDDPKFHFKDIYRTVLKKETDPTPSGSPPISIRGDVLHAGLPPSDAQITDAKNKLWNDKYAIQIITVGSQAINKDQVTQAFTDESAKLPNLMRLDVAKNSKIYVSSDALAVNPAMLADVAPNLVDLWWAQQTLWVQQDVAQALSDANASATNILDAPVKHLISLTVPASYSNGGSTAAGSAAAAPVPTDINSPLPTQMNVSASGRVSNAMFDVITFNMVINVDATQVPNVLAAISKGRLITVLNVEMSMVDSAAEQEHGFIYGSAPIVQLSLQCEDLFMRTWTVPLMPAQIKLLMGLQPPAAPGT